MRVEVMLGWSKIEDTMKDLGSVLGEHTNPETDKITTVIIGVEVEKREDLDDRTFFITFACSDERAWFQAAFFDQLKKIAEMNTVDAVDDREDYDD